MEHIQIEPDSSAAGKTLRYLDIRKNSGASVIAIARNGEAITNPAPDIILQGDDIVVLIGAHRDLDAAVKLLTQRVVINDSYEGAQDDRH